MMNIEKNKEDVNVPTPSPQSQMEDLTSNKEISQRPEEQVASDGSTCVSSDEEDLQQTPAGSDGTSSYGQILEHLTGKARRNFKRKMRRKRLGLHMKALKSENASADSAPVSWGLRGGPPGSTIYINRPRYTRGPMKAVDPGSVSWGPRRGPPGSTIYINRPRYTPASSYTRGPMKRQADRAARKQPIVLPTEPASRREESVPSGRCVQEEPDSTRRSPDLSTPSVRTSGTRRYRTPSSEEEEPASSEWRRLGSPTLPKARSVQDKTDYAERPSVLGTVRPPSVTTRGTRRYRTPSREEEEPTSFEWTRRGTPTLPKAHWDQDKTDYAERPSVPGTVRPPSVSTSGARQYRTPSPEEEETVGSGWTRCGSPTHPKVRWDQDQTDYVRRSPDTSRTNVPVHMREPCVSTRATRRYRTPSPEEEEPASSEWRRRRSPTHPEARWDQDKTDYAERSPDTSRPSVPGTVRQPSVSTRGTRRYRTPSPEEEEPMRSGWTRCGSPTLPKARWDQDKTDYAERLPDTSRPSVSVVTRQPSSRQYRTPSPEEKEPASFGWTRCGNPKARCDQDQTDYAKSSPDPQPYSSRFNEAAEAWHPSVSTNRTRHYRMPSPDEEEHMRSLRCGSPTHAKAYSAQDKTGYAERSPDPQPYGSRSSESAVTRQPSVSTERTRHYRTPSPEEVNDDYPTYAGVFPISKQSAPSTSQPTPGQTKLHVVIRSDRPSGLVLPDEAERIRAYVVEESLRAMEEDGVPVLRFLNSGRIDIGWFLVIAYDVGTWDWLLTRLPPLAIGEQVFWAVRVADAPWPVRVGFRVRTEGPLCQERLERMLRLQNPTFNVREWMFLGAADEGREGECLVTFLISQEEAALLDQAGWTLFYELGAVTVQRLTVHGRDAVQDPSGADRRSE